MAEGGRISDDKILEMLKFLNVPVSKNEIKTPTRDFILRVFECFLKDLQIDINSPELVTWEAMRHFEDTDIYEDAQKLILYAMTVNTFTCPSGLTITVRDITDPKPKRTKKILYYIMVFWNYYIQKYARFHAIEETFQAEKQKTDELICENELLDEKYQDLCKTLEKCPDKEELWGAIQARKEKLDRFEKQKTNLLSEYDELKMEISNAKSKVNEAEVQIANARKKLVELDQHILSSPERVPGEVQMLKDKIKAEDIKIKEREAKLKEIEKKVRMQEETLKNHNQVLLKFEDVNDQLKDLSVTVKSVVACDEELIKEQEELIKLHAECQQKQISKEVRMQAVLNATTLKKTLFDELQNLQREDAKEKEALNSLKESNSGIINEIDVKSDAIIELSLKSKDAIRSYHDKIDGYMSRIKSTCSSFNADCESIHSTLKNCFSE